MPCHKRSERSYKKKKVKHFLKYFYLVKLNNVVEYEGSECSDIDNNQPLEFEELDDMSDISINARSSAMEIARHICESNLNKLSSKKLINLLNYLHLQQEPPPQSLAALWTKLNIQFNYRIIKYCTNCIVEITRCDCNRMNDFIHSELILFPINEEIARVVRNNYDDIFKCKLQQHSKEEDVINGNPYNYVSLLFHFN